MADLHQVEPTLALFAQGIGGRYRHLRAGEEDAADLSHLHLPASIDLFADDAWNKAAYRLRTLVQLGFEAFGTFEFDLALAREHLPELAERPAPTPGRESDLTAFFGHFEAPAVARQLFHALERARVEARTLATYPGAQKYHAALAPFVETPPAPLREAMERLKAPAATVYDTAREVCLCYAALAPGTASVSPEFPGQLEWLQREARLEDWREELDATNAQLATLALLDAADETQVREGQGDGDIRDVGKDLVAQRDQLRRRIDMERAALRHRLGDSHEAAKSFHYDEWDYLRGAYKRGWCRLFEETLTATEPEDSEKLLAAVRPYAKAVRRRFEHIRPSGYQRIGKVADGDELDLAALVDVRASLRAGVAADDRVYSRRDRLRRDVGAAFLVDLSASTDDPARDGESPQEATGASTSATAANLRDPFFDDDDDPYAALDNPPPPAPERRRIIDIEKEAVALLATALEGLGDPYAVYGFSGYGHDCVEFYVAKEFEQPLNRQTLDAIAAMKPKRSTRMGPAIRHAAAKLRRHGAALKVLLIVSDGFPQDCDYGPTRGDHEYGLRDTAKAIAEAERDGVHAFCVTVDRSGHDYLRRMCAETRYMVIEETEQLPLALQKAYRQLTRV